MHHQTFGIQIELLPFMAMRIKRETMNLFDLFSDVRGTTYGIAEILCHCKTPGYINRKFKYSKVYTFNDPIKT